MNGDDAYALKMERERDALELARVLLAGCSPWVKAWAVWKVVRCAVRSTESFPLDRLEWRGRCHRLNGIVRRFTWRDRVYVVRDVSPRERRRCLRRGRDYPLAGPVGCLP